MSNLSDTQWLIEAITREIMGVGVVDKVQPWSGQQFDGAWEALRSYPDSVAFVIPQELKFEHAITTGVIISVDKIRACTVIVSMGQPGSVNGDWVGLAAAVDALCDHLNLCKFGMRADALCLVQSAVPVDIYYDDAPGRAAWRIDLQVRRAV